MTKMDEEQPLVSHASAPAGRRTRVPTSTAKLLKAGCALLVATAAVAARLRAPTAKKSATALTDTRLDALYDASVERLSLNASADDAVCVASWGKCGGGIWSQHVGHTCCDPDYSCYWKRGSDVQGCESAYAQVCARAAARELPVAS